MMVLTDKEFKTKVKDEGTKAIYFYAGHISELEGTRPFKRMNCNSNDELIDNLNTFSESFQHKFTCYIHSSTVSITTKGDMMYVDFSRRETVVEAVSVPQQNVDVDKLKSEIKKELRVEQEHNIVKQKLDIANKQLEKQEFMSEKLGMVFYQFLQKAGMSLDAPMQGSETEEESETSEPMNIEIAMIYIQKMLGDKFIIKLAGDIKADPSLADKLKAML